MQLSRRAVHESFQAIHAMAAYAAERRKIFSATLANPEKNAAASAGSPSRLASISVLEVERWLSKGWTRRKSDIEKERAMARAAEWRAAHPVEAAAADAAAAAAERERAHAEAEAARQRAEKRMLLHGGFNRSHRDLERQLANAKVASARTRNAAVAAHRSLPPVSSTAQQLLGVPTKELLQQACRIAEDGGATQWQRVNAEIKRYERLRQHQQETQHQQARSANKLKLI